MTRFARAEGSKASNKRECEEATPWEEIKTQMIKKKKKKEKDGNKQIDSDKKLNFSPAKHKEVNSDNLKEQNVNKKNKKSCEKIDSNLLSSSEKNFNGSPSKFQDINSDIEINDKQNRIKSENLKKKKPLSLEVKKNWIIEDGKRYKVFKNGVKKPWIDLPYEENDVMTRYKNFFIKIEDVNELNQFKKSLEEQNLSEKDMNKQMLHKERKLHNKLRVELLKKQLPQYNKPKTPTTNNRAGKNLNMKTFQNSKNSKSGKQILFPKNEGNKNMKDPKEKSKQNLFPKFEENYIMTNYEGYWILRENLQHLKRVEEIKIDRIINNRTDDNSDRNLTQKELILFRRLMKKEKRREHALLENFLKTNKRNKNILQTESQNRFGERNQWHNNNTNDFVKFDGYYVPKEGAERLQKLKETMLAKGCTEEEITEVIKTERRKEERALKRSNKSFCYQCRQPGHEVSFCPQNEKDGKSNNYVICFKCGSAEHTAKNCRSKAQSSSSSSAYPLATCFICKEVGHISRECPDNPRGLYPNGGCCKLCGSVEHLRRDCPELQQQNAEETVTLSTFRHGDKVEEIDNAYKDPLSFNSEKKKKPKVVKF